MGDRKKIIITGGHITPALAVLPKLQQTYDVVFIGRKYAYEGDITESFEYKIIKNLEVPFKVLTTGRLQRKFTRYTIPSIIKIPFGFIQAFSYLLIEKPHLLLSFGGYIALPVAIAASFLRIPIVTHEQTMTVGLANKVIEKLAKRVCISFKETQQNLNDSKTVLTGNPVRNELFHPGKESPFLFTKQCYQDGKLLPIIYVTGGSGGSHVINQLIKEIAPTLLERYILIHQTGNPAFFNDFEQLNQFVKCLPSYLQVRYVVKQLITTQQLGWIYHNVKLLIGRSGANTTTEILTFNIPSILIPLQIAGANEQLKQAQFVQRTGHGIMLEQNEATPQKLLETIEEIIKNYQQFKGEKIAIHKNAVNAIVSIVGEVLNENTAKKEKTIG